MRTVCQPVKPLARGMDKEASKIITASLRVGTKQRVPHPTGLINDFWGQRDHKKNFFKIENYLIWQYIGKKSKEPNLKIHRTQKAWPVIKPLAITW